MHCVTKFITFYDERSLSQKYLPDMRFSTCVHVYVYLYIVYALVFLLSIVHVYVHIYTCLNVYVQIRMNTCEIYICI